ncbi:MAG: hypothetical protein EB120_10685 [Proteobacteria bacterium]|nr:hypothetical protein [Pseudomonadota bacterium]
MQADGAAIVTFSKQLFASASAGYVPLPASLSESQKASLSHIISREHYLGLRPAKGHGIYAGLMDVAFGLRVPDHNAFLRANTLLNMNDQTHGLLYHYDWEQGELALHFFLGKLNQDSASRQKGGTLYSEFLVDENFRLGGSLWYSESSFRSRQMLATHMRMQAGKGSSLLAEVGIFRQSLSSSTDSSIGLFSFLQSRHLFFRGFAGLMTFEAYLDRFAEGGIRTFRAGPSLEYLPFPQCEIRADFLGSQNQGLNTVAPNSYLLQVQTHVWL